MTSNYLLNHHWITFAPQVVMLRTHWRLFSLLLAYCVLFCIRIEPGVEGKARINGWIVPESTASLEHFEYILNVEIGDEFPFNNLTFQSDGLITQSEKLSSDVISIFWQVEHGILLSDADCGSQRFVSESKRDSCYHLRYEPEHSLLGYDIVIEYSLPNVFVLQQSGQYSKNILSKILYIPPMSFKKSKFIATTQRSIDCLALYSARTFAPGTRRAAILDTLHTAGVTVTVISDKHKVEEAEDTFRHSKIVLNTHQTDTHHTLEEFRVLPALLHGAIVVSEPSPFMHVVPYHEYIIFSETSDLAHTIKDVLDNYEYYYGAIHGPESRLKDIFVNMRQKARTDTEAALLRVLCNKENSPLALSGYAGCDDVLFIDPV